jgi:hypothetical protein
LTSLGHDKRGFISSTCRLHWLPSLLDHRATTIHQLPSTTSQPNHPERKHFFIPTHPPIAKNTLPTLHHAFPHPPRLNCISPHPNHSPHNWLLSALFSSPRRTNCNPPPSRNLHPTSSRRRRCIRNHTRRNAPPSLVGDVHGREVLGTWYAVPTSIMWSGRRGLTCVNRELECCWKYYC